MDITRKQGERNTNQEISNQAFMGIPGLSRREGAQPPLAHSHPRGIWRGVPESPPRRETAWERPRSLLLHRGRGTWSSELTPEVRRQHSHSIGVWGWSGGILENPKQHYDLSAGGGGLRVCWLQGLRPSERHPQSETLTKGPWHPPPPLSKGQVWRKGRWRGEAEKGADEGQGVP